MNSTAPNDFTRWLINSAKKAKKVSDLIPRMHSKVQEDNPELMETILQNESFQKTAQKKGIAISQLIEQEAKNLSYQQDATRLELYRKHNVEFNIEGIKTSEVKPQTADLIGRIIVRSRINKDNPQSPQENPETPAELDGNPLSLPEKQIGRLHLLADSLSEYEKTIANSKKHSSSELEVEPDPKRRKITPENSPIFNILDRGNKNFEERISSIPRLPGI